VEVTADVAMHAIRLGAGRYVKTQLSLYLIY